MPELSRTSLANEPPGVRPVTGPGQGPPRRSPKQYTGRVTGTWEPSDPGVFRLPSGRVVRGRGLKRPLPDGPLPGFALYFVGREPAPVEWESRWIKWPDFRLPADPGQFAAGLREAWERAERERVEFACGGGRGRTGTALACLAIMDGVPAAEAVSYVREHYSSHAVETPWQRKFIERFSA